MSAKPAFLLLALVTALACRTPAAAQDLITVEREQVLTSFGSVIWKTPRPLPVRHGVGNTVEVGHDGATSLRLHFKVGTAAAASTWAVEILSLNGEDTLWTYTPAAGEDSFWSRDVRGPRVKVRVISTQADSPLQVSVDGAAVTGTQVKPQAIDGPDEREKMENQTSDTLKTAAKAVARIRFIGDDNKQYFCTGFLVSSDLMMTNQHCPQSETEWRNALIDFDYNAAGAIPKVTTFKQFILSNVALDVSIFRLSWTPPGRVPLALEGATLQERRELIVIQHPAGEPKQVSRTGCIAIGVQLRGVTPLKTDFGHGCDTLGGSSGSGVMDISTLKVIGLHHLGFEPTDPCILNPNNPAHKCLVNRAVEMKQIIDFIKTKRPDISAEIGLTP